MPILPLSHNPAALRSPGPKGFSYIEVMVALVILLYVSYGVIQNFQYLGNQTQGVDDKAFAAQKVIQIIEELRSMIPSAANGIASLDSFNKRYDDLMLTTRASGDFSHPLSGNPYKRYARRIAIEGVPNDSMARKVTVQVVLYNPALPPDKEEVLAESMTVLRTLDTAFQPIQNFKMFLLMIDNIPSMGLYTGIYNNEYNFPAENAFVGARDALQGSYNIELKDSYFVTMSAYGRDPYYAPYINQSTSSVFLDNKDMMVYFYPRKVGGNAWYPSASVGEGWWNYTRRFNRRFNWNNGLTASAGFQGGSMADQFNAGVRWPEEYSLAGQKYTLRTFLEYLHRGSDGLRNAIVINTHGELLPVPPMRNYSDPAKDPSNPDNKNVRVVTHPEQLRYFTGDPVALRVYSFYMPDPGKTLDDAPYSDTSKTTDITLLLKGIDLTAPGKIKVEWLKGGNPDGAGGTVNYGREDAPSANYSISKVGSDTKIILKGSLLRSPAVSGRGIRESDRLYGLEYIPCQVGDGAWINLDESHPGGSDKPRNTARWILTFAAGAFPQSTSLDIPQKVETRIGNNVTSGNPENLSSTYFWVGLTPPITEQFQFTGDPRYMPYGDVKENQGYNWYFGVNPEDAGYPGFDRSTGQLWDGRLNIDVPRYMQVYREGIINSGAIFVNFSAPRAFNYIGMGGEVGYGPDQNLPKGILTVSTPWKHDSSVPKFVDEFTDITNSAADFKGKRLIARYDNQWYSRPWIGELYPDNMISVWKSSGNLSVGHQNLPDDSANNVINSFYRAPYSIVTPTSHEAALPNSHGQTYLKGGASFFNGTNQAGVDKYFGQELVQNSNGSILAPGLTFVIPPSNPIKAEFPYKLDMTDSIYRPPEWALTATQRTLLTTHEAFYDPTPGMTDYHSYGLIRMTRDGSKYGNVLISGFNEYSDYTLGGKAPVAGALRTFMTLGAPAVSADPITQMPYTTILKPAEREEFVNASTVTITWESAWLRWDGYPYTEAYPKNFNPADYGRPTLVKYNVKYSADNGSTWRPINSPASSVGTGGYTQSQDVTSPLIWDVSALPRGPYYIRIEAYRLPSSRTSQTPYPNYSYHTRKISILKVP